MQDIFQNNVVLKIHGGTDHEDYNLCATCQNCHKYRESRTGEDVVICNLNTSKPMRMRGEVSRCNSYVDARRPSLSQMRDIAWQVVTHRHNKTIGFISPEEYFRKRKEEQGW